MKSGTAGLEMNLLGIFIESMTNTKGELIQLYGQVTREIKNRLSLSQVMDKICPLPGESVVLGMGEDGKPVLMNIRDSIAPNIVIWDKLAKQGLRILKVLAEYIFHYHAKCGVFAKSDGKKVEFLVLTRYPEDWGELNDYGMGMRGKTSCIGIIPFYSDLADKVIHGLAAWVNEPHNSSKSPVLILIDGLENLKDMDADFKLNLWYLLSVGRRKNIYVIGTATKKNFHLVHGWLEGFQAEIYGCDAEDLFEMMEDKKQVYFYAPKTEMI